MEHAEGSKMKSHITHQKKNMKINNLIPESVWYVLIGLNIGMFTTGTMLDDPGLMSLSLISAAACGVSLYMRDNDK